METYACIKKAVTGLTEKKAETVITAQISLHLPWNNGQAESAESQEAR